MNNIYKTANNAYYKAIANCHTEELQDEACKYPMLAYWYAMEVKGADIDYCQKMACKDPYFAYCFAKNIVGADLEACLVAVSGTELEGDVRELIVKKVIG